MLGWFSWPMASASRWKRSCSSSSSSSSADSIFRATIRPRLWSRARYTTPMAPSPSLSRISYRPNVATSISGRFGDPVLLRIAQEHDGDVVLAARLVGGIDELVDPLLEGGRRRREDLEDLVVVDHGMQAVTADQDDIAGRELALDDLELDRVLGADGLGDDVLEGVPFDLLGVEDPLGPGRGHPGVVACQLHELVAAQQIAAAVPRGAHRQDVLADDRRHGGRAHARVVLAVVG